MKLLSPPAARAKFILFGLSLAGFLLGIYIGLRPAAVNLAHLELPDVDKKLRYGEEWLGEVVVVNHWATWCAPCREEIPLLVEYQRRHGIAGVRIVGVAHDRLDAVRAFGEEFGINYPSLVAIVGGEKIMAQHRNTTGGLPFTAFFDRRGNLAHTHLGPITEPELRAAIAPLL